MNAPKVGEWIEDENGKLDWHEQVADSPGLGVERAAIRSLANLLVCTSTELPFTQLPDYTAKVDKFERIILEHLSQTKP